MFPPVAAATLAAAAGSVTAESAAPALRVADLSNSPIADSEDGASAELDREFPPSPTLEPPAERSLTPGPEWQFFAVRPGDSLSKIFAELGLDAADLAQLLRSGGEAKALNEMRAGYELGLKVDRNGRLEEFRLLQSPLDELVFSRAQTGFQVERLRHTPRIETAIKGGTVYSSLLAATGREQVPTTQSMRMVEVFGGEIDFVLDTQPGDQFTILYEQQYLGGEYVGEGEMLVARFVNRGKEHLALRYENKDGRVGYYSPDGENKHRSLMRNPLDVFRISSHFNPRRLHPIHNTIRAHKGTDYAAPSGTPVRVTSGGTVTRASRYGSYGNIVIVTHEDGFETRYAHLSRFAEGIEPGARVSQSEVIGFVGATGSATGPHLHYEVLKDGVARDPSKVHELMPPAPGIAAAEMDRFRGHAENLLAQFDAQNRELQRRNSAVSAD